MFKNVHFLGTVFSKRAGTGSESGKPWVSLTVTIPGRSKVEGEDAPLQYHSCYCTGSHATTASGLEKGDLVEIKGVETLEKFMYQDSLRFSQNVEVDEITAAEPQKEEKAFTPPPPPPKGDDDDSSLPF